MKQFKITYFHPTKGLKSVVIEANSQEEADKDFMDLIIDGRQIGYCKNEEVI